MMTRMSLKVPKSARTSSNTRLVIRAELEGSDPPIWRKLQIAPHLRLDQVHGVLQAAFGWEDCHLHEFQVPAATRTGKPKRRFVMDMDEEFTFGEKHESETEVFIEGLLSSKGQKLRYLYDFGDSWEVMLTFEEIIETEGKVPYARCLEGQRAWPPDDSGGIWHYQWTMDTIQNPSDPDYPQAVENMEWWAEMAGLDEWDPEAFDLAAVDKEVRKSVLR